MSVLQANGVAGELHRPRHVIEILLACLVFSRLKNVRIRFIRAVQRCGRADMSLRRFIVTISALG